MLFCVQALHNPFVLLVLVGLVGFGVHTLRQWLKTEQGAAKRDQLLIRVPILGDLLRKIEVTRICESLATLYGAGLPLLQCIEVTAEACENTLGRQALLDIADDVRDGKPVWRGMKRSGFFTRSVVQMVNVGEESATLETMLGKIAQYNDLEVRTALEQFAAAIEPVMIVGLGVVVTVIVLVAFAPLYQLIAVLG
jgi:type IV pilus assembly protein PilC